MSLSRFTVTMLLTLALIGAPALRTVAMAAPQGPEAGGSHVAHCTQLEHAADHASMPGHGNSKDSCDSHQSCDGSCCTACAACVVAVVLPPATAAAVLARSVRNPVEPSLSSFSLVSLRERPPRVLSL